MKNLGIRYQNEGDGWEGLGGQLAKAAFADLFPKLWIWGGGAGKGAHLRNQRKQAWGSCRICRGKDRRDV